MACTAQAFFLVAASVVAAKPDSAERLPTPMEVASILRETSVQTLYVVSSSHWDLGFADPTDVVQDRVKAHLDEVVANCLKEPRLRWSVESVWQVLEWLKRTPGMGQRGRFFDLVRERRIDIGATFGGMHTAHMSAEEVCRFLYAGQRLAQDHGLVIDTAMMNDVPGYSWALPQVFSRAGVKHFLTGVNARFGGRLRIPLKDRPFWWVGRDGSRLLTWICDGYSEAARTYHLPPTEARFFADAFRKPWLKKIRDLDRIQELGMATALRKLEESGYTREYLVTISSQDFISSDRAVALHKWIDRWNARHSKPQIVQTTPSQFFAEVAARRERDYPTYSGDFSGLWETGHVNAPAFRANVNVLREQLGSLETVATLSSLLAGEPYPRLRLDDSWLTLLQCHEHGLGLGVGWPKLMTRAGVIHMNRFGSRLAESAAERTQFLLRRHVRAIGDRARTKVSTLLVFSPLPWRRTSLVDVQIASSLLDQSFALVDESTGRALPHDVLRESSAIRFVAEDLPSVGYRRYRIDTARETSMPSDRPIASDGRLRGEAFDVRVDEATGRITAVTDRRKGRELLRSSECRFARLLRRGHRADYLGVDSFEPADEGPAQVTYENTTTTASIVVLRPNAPLARLKLTLCRGLGDLFVEMTLDKTRTRQVPRAEHSDQYYASFDFDLDPEAAQYRFDGPAGFLDPREDFLPGAMRGRFVAQHAVEMIDASGYKIVMSPREACIGQIGPAASRGPKFAPKRAQLLWKVFSDADAGVARDLGLVRYPSIEPGPQQVRFHFALRVESGERGGHASCRFGVEQAVQPIACFLPPAVKPFMRPLPPRRPSQQSLVQVSPANVLLLTMKQPEDGAGGDIVMRFMELEGRQTDVSVTTAIGLRSAVRCDLFERPDARDACLAKPLRFGIGPYEIATIRARRTAPE